MTRHQFSMPFDRTIKIFSLAKFTSFAFAWTLFFIAAMSAGHAQEDTQTEPDAFAQDIQVLRLWQPSVPPLAAKSYVLYDFTSNQILSNQDSDKRFEPASLTKLMTAYLTFSALRLNQISLGQSTLPPPEALQSEETESRMFLD